MRFFAMTIAVCAALLSTSECSAAAAPRSELEVPATEWAWTVSWLPFESGAFLIAWRVEGADGQYSRFAFQCFGSTGTPLGTPAPLAMGRDREAIGRPGLAPVGESDFAAFLLRRSDDESGIELVGRIFRCDGEPRSASLRINDESVEESFYIPRLALDPRGGFALVWQESGSRGRRLVGRRFADGCKRMSEAFSIAEDAAPARAPALAIQPNGLLGVVWKREGSPGENVLRFFDASNERLERDSVIHDTGASVVSMTAGRDGQFLLFWLAGHPDGADLRGPHRSFLWNRQSFVSGVR